MKAKRDLAWLKFTGLFIVIFLFLLPLLGAIYTSLRTNNAINSSAILWEFDHQWSHFRNSLGAAGYDFQRFFLNSILISTGTVILTLFISLPASYSVTRLGFGNRWLIRIALILRITPAIFFIIPFYKLFSNYGLIDKIPVLILADSFVNIPLALIVLSGSIADLPYEIEEAAAVDGASIFRTFRSIVLPLLGPSIGAAAILTFLFSWSDYLFAVVLTSSNATPVTVGAANFVTSYGVRWGDISAAVVLSVIPPLVFATVFQRYLIKGLAAGAVKG
jgi:multiple sugar transport system permease protein